MAIESYNLIYVCHSEKGVKFNVSERSFWLPKSQIEVDGVSHESDFEELVRHEAVDVYIPDWLAEEKGLI